MPCLLTAPVGLFAISLFVGWLAAWLSFSSATRLVIDRGHPGSVWTRVFSRLMNLKRLILGGRDRIIRHATLHIQGWDYRLKNARFVDMILRLIHQVDPHNIDAVVRRE